MPSYRQRVRDLEVALDACAETERFSGAVQVTRDGSVELTRTYAMADRRHRVANQPDTQFAIASGLKGMTALAVVSLVESAQLRLDTTARSLLGDDLPLIRDDVTVEHLLAHRSGIGDYLDEGELDDVTDYVLAVPPHRLVDAEDYLPVLDGFETAFAPDERFAYCNGGYVVLAIVAERAGGVPYHRLVHDRVLTPAGMADTAFLRSDELPSRAATGYLDVDSLRTNVLHLPVRGCGDGGVYSTLADMTSFWTALFAGRVVAPSWVDEMTRPHSDVPDEGCAYGLGFWLASDGRAVWLAGYDAGVSFVSTHEPAERLTYTVMSNTSEGAWPVSKLLDAHFAG
jgi:CubicO group peptidase (beta-lactamase class C family)